jgi:hypothetical protein
MIFILGVIVMIDVWLDRSQKGNTFSSRFRALGRVWPPARILIAAVVGGVLTHFWWTPQDIYDSGGTKLCPCADVGVNISSKIPVAGPSL